MTGGMSTMGERVRGEHEPMYEGATLTVAEWLEAEVDIDPGMPRFEHPKIPYLDLKTEMGAFRAHHYNTEVVKYTEDWEHMSHIVLEDETQHDSPIYFFRNLYVKEGEEETWVTLAQKLMELDFSLKAPPERPFPYIFEQYYKGIRGDVDMEDIITELLDGSE